MGMLSAVDPRCGLFPVSLGETVRHHKVLERSGGGWAYDCPR